MIALLLAGCTSPHYEDPILENNPQSVYPARDYQTLLDDWILAQTAVTPEVKLLVFPKSAETPYLFIPEPQSDNFKLDRILFKNSRFSFLFTLSSDANQNSGEMLEIRYSADSPLSPNLEDYFSTELNKWILNIHGQEVQVSLPDSLTVEDSSVLREWFKFTFYTLDGEPSETAPA